MIRAEGIENIWERHNIGQGHLGRGCMLGGGWAHANEYQDSSLRSTAVTALHMGIPHAKNLRNWTQHSAGLTLGIGLGMSTPEDPKGDGFSDLVTWDT